MRPEHAKGFGFSPFWADDDAEEVLGEDSSTSGPTQNPATDKAFERISNKEVTADWVTQRLAYNAEISVGLRPSMVRMKLIPRDPSSGLPVIVREIRIYSKEGTAGNQALVQLGKSLAMFKGEREARPQRVPREKTTPEYYRRMSRLSEAIAKRMEEAEAMKKEREDGEQKTKSDE